MIRFTVEALAGAQDPVFVTPATGDLDVARRWFAAFESGRSNHAEELDSTATKLGRFAGRAFAELRRRAKDSQS